MDVHDQLTSEVPEWFLLAGWDVCPAGWRPRPLDFFPFRFIERGKPEPMMVIVTGNTERDGKRWVHVSMSRPSRMPSYADMCRVKHDFIGDGRQAIQLFVPSDQHYNYHSYCLHLWHCIDGDGLPDFRHGGGV